MTKPTRTQVAARAPRHNELARIHILKSQIEKIDPQFDRDAYEAVLFALTGKKSAADITKPQREQVARHLESLKAALQGRQRSATPLLGKAQAMWSALGKARAVSEASDSALGSFVKRQYQVDHIRFCSQSQLANLVDTLKAWARREGVFNEQTGRIESRKAA